jgi:hypothetical protein
VHRSVGCAPASFYLTYVNLADGNLLKSTWEATLREPLVPMHWRAKSLLPLPRRIALRAFRQSLREGKDKRVGDDWTKHEKVP